MVDLVSDFTTACLEFRLEFRCHSESTSAICRRSLCSHFRALRPPTVWSPQGAPRPEEQGEHEVLLVCRLPWSRTSRRGGQNPVDQVGGDGQPDRARREVSRRAKRCAARPITRNTVTIARIRPRLQTLDVDCRGLNETATSSGSRATELNTAARTGRERSKSRAAPRGGDSVGSGRLRAHSGRPRGCR